MFICLPISDSYYFLCSPFHPLSLLLLKGNPGRSQLWELTGPGRPSQLLAQLTEQHGAYLFLPIYPSIYLCIYQSISKLCFLSILFATSASWPLIGSQLNDLFVGLAVCLRVYLSISLAYQLALILYNNYRAYLKTIRSLTPSPRLTLQKR